MRRTLAVLAVLLGSTAAHAHGLLIPEEKTLPPLAMLNHKVSIVIDDQVAVTTVDQTFRNHTDRPLEATYVFPVPKGASVNKFTMSVDGKEVKGEMVEASKARSIYESIVRRTQDPGLLEYMGNNLLRLRVFPVPAKGDQKVTLSYSSVAGREGELVEYIYPLKTNGKATATLKEFAIEATIKSQHGVQNVYSPTHAIDVKRAGDNEVKVVFEREQGLLDKDFQMFYQTGGKDVGLTAMMHRPIAGEDGYFMLLMTPKVELGNKYQVPRDMVFVLDSSGSMQGPKMEQAKKALKYCLENLGEKDRFSLVSFATTVNKYRDEVVEASADHRAAAAKWVDKLSASGGTAIEDALTEALAMRPSDDQGRPYTVIFFSDGQPTIGETNPEKILKKTLAKNTANTRIFTFGVGYGDNINATLLDQLADQTRALSTYVRPEEEIGTKVAGLYSKISRPVLAGLKVSPTAEVRFSEVYPVQLPDLFHGQQLIVMGRFSGKGPAAIKLTGTVGLDAKEFVFETTFPERTNDDKSFVEQIWARRKVGYLMDQIRVNGEKQELVDEVVSLAKKYGITTPYTSYLIVPDGPLPVVNAGTPPAGVPMPMGGFGGGFGGFTRPEAFTSPLPTGIPGAGGSTSTPGNVTDFARLVQDKPGSQFMNRERFEDRRYSQVPGGYDPNNGLQKALNDAKDKKGAYDQARDALSKKQQAETQRGKLGVDLSVQMNNLRNQTRLEYTAQRMVAGRNCLEVGGVWIDENFDAKMPVVAVKAQSDAYFRILERHGQVKDVYQLGNHLVWVTPNKTALVIDTNDGKDTLTDEEIDKLFVVAK